MQNHSAIHWREVTGALTLAGLVWVAAAIGAPPAQAQTYTPLYSFKGGTTDGENPEGSLFMDAAGNLYGTTVAAHAPYAGTAFKLDTTGTETVLHRFKGAGGASPYGGLIRDATGNSYGTTSAGGASNSGSVFKLGTTGTETRLHSFTGAPSGCGTTGNPPCDGAFPYAGLIRDRAGNLYGTTSAGGASNSGTVFKVTAAGAATVLYSFCAKSGCTDGATPYGSLLRTSTGILYGTTSAGGITAGNCFPYGCGVVFRLDPTTGSETVLYSFAGSPDGAHPYGGLVPDSAGNVYGTTFEGGTGACTNGCGVVFEVPKVGTEKVLYSFTGYPNDGAFPYAGLVRDSAGNMYGTTAYGGTSDKGVVFKLDTTDTESVLHSFAGAPSGCGTTGNPPCDGENPRASLLLDSTGNLYGTTYLGGTVGTVCGGSPADSCGIVFKLVP